jgi:ATP-dependent exoDNAse (exonuclease V) beta subunit
MYGLGIAVDYHCIKDDRLEFEYTIENISQKFDYYFPTDTPSSSYSLKYRMPCEIAGNKNVKVQIVQDFEHRISINGTLDETEMGNCLHDILYLMESKLDEVKVSAIIENFNLTGRIFENEVLKAVANLQVYIQALKPIAIYRELPLRMEKSGSIYIGAPDLVLELTEGLCLIDYKSYPGKTTEILNSESLHFAGIYSGQLDAYSEMLETILGKKVFKKLIYYSVIGKIVEVE